MADTLSVPIKINLNGDYTIPVEGQAPIAGSVTGDLRLPMLDAFLQSLNGPLKVGQPAAVALGRGFRRIKSRLDPAILADQDVVLEITCSTNPTTHEIKHTFRFGTAAKDKA